MSGEPLRAIDGSVAAASCRSGGMRANNEIGAKLFPGDRNEYPGGNGNDEAVAVAVKALGGAAALANSVPYRDVLGGVREQHWIAAECRRVSEGEQG